ncbi:hypothetical protein D3C86_651200 [compost metagenome]
MRTPTGCRAARPISRFVFTIQSSKERVRHDRHLHRHPPADRRPMGRRRRRQDARRAEPRHRQGHRQGGARQHRRPRPCPGRRPARLRSLARHARQRARRRDAPRRRPDPRTRPGHRQAADAGTRQAAGRGQGRNDGRRRHHRVVRRRRPPRVRPHRALAQPGRAAAGHQGAGRPRRGLHAVELPRQPDRAQARRRAGHRLLLPGEGARGNPGLAGRAAQGFRRRRHSGRRGGPGVRQPGRDLELPHRASDHPQGHLHRLDPGGQAAGRTGRFAHEARHDGTGRPRPGDRGRRRRRGAGRQGRRCRQVPQRGPGLHLADPLPGAQQPAP